MIAGLSILCGGLLQDRAQAQFTDWTLDGTGNWTNPANWSGNVPGNPVFPEIARIDQTGGMLNVPTAQVTTLGASTYFGLTVGNNSAGALQVLNGGTLFSGPNAFFLTPDVILASGLGSSADVLISGTGSLWTVLVDFYIGWNGDATLTIADGGRLDSTTIANAGFGSNGTATIDISGTNSTWNSISELNLAVDGTADLTISDGGRLSSTNTVDVGSGATGDGSVTVSGADSRWDGSGGVVIGGAGNGDLSVNTGGVADFSAGGLTLGEAAGSTATLTLSDAASSVNTGDFILADGGDAGLTVSGGASLTSGVVTLADDIGSTATAGITGVGSSWTALDSVFGKLGTANLTVEAGAALNTAVTKLAEGVGANASLAVDGSGSSWGASDVTIGESGTATFDLTDGATASASGTLTMGATTGSSGTATISGGSGWTVAGDASIGEFGTGVLNIGSAGTVGFDSAVVLASESSGVGNATVDGVGSSLGTGGLTIGSNGSSDVSVLNGASLTGGAVVIGEFSGSTGDLTASGIGSSFTFDSLVVGSAGDGTLLIDGGASGTIVSGTFTLGSALTGTADATISGTGTSLLSQGAIVADSGSVGLVASGGALINSSGDVVFGSGLGSIADVDVLDTDTLWEVGGGLTVGAGGDATLEVGNGATVRSLGGTNVASGLTSSGAVTVSGADSEFRTAGNLDLGFGSGRSASLTVGDGLAYVTESVLIGSGASVFLNGGELSVDDLSLASGGAFNWTSGQLTVRGPSGLTIGPSGPLGGNLAVSAAAGQFLEVTNTLTVEPASFFAVSGDALSAGAIINDGLASFNGGTVSVGVGGFTNNAFAAFDNATVAGDYTNSPLALTSVANTVTFQGATGGGGSFDWPSGTVNVTGAGGMSVGSNGLMGATVAIDAGAAQFLNVTNTLTVDSGASLSVTGNALGAGGVVNDGQLSFDGSLFVPGAGGIVNNGEAFFTDTTIGGLLTNNAGATTEVTGTVVFDNGGGAGSAFDWVSGTVRVNSAGGLLVGSGGLLGTTLAVDASAGQFLDVTNVLTVGIGGQLDVNGSGLSAGGITNSGQIGFTGGTVSVGGGGFVNNNQASFDGTTIDGDYSSPAGSSTSITGTVVFNGALGGAGNFTGNGVLQVEGDHDPGDSPARVEIDGDLVYGAGSTATFELGGTISGLEYDVVAVGGDVSLAGTLGVDVINGFALVPGMSFRIIEVGGLLTGTFAGLGEGATVGNFTGEDLFISYTGGDGNDVALYTSAPPVPEPGVATLLLAAFGLAGLRRRRRV